MIIRHRLRAGDLDALGVLTPEACRMVAYSLWDAPSEATVIIDLGPVRQLQVQLVRDLSLYRCAHMIRWEGPDWRSVRDHTRALAKSLGVPA